MLERKIYKNWKERCEEVGWKTTGGTYKKSREKDLNDECHYHKEGNKIVIDEIFGELSEETDKRKNNGGNSTKSTKENDGRRNKNSIYKELDDIILNYLYCHTSDDTVNVTKKQLVRKCEFDINIQETDEYNKETINDVMNVYKNILTHAVDSSLKRLEKKGFINYKYTFMVHYEGIWRLATEEEEMKIKEVEEQVKEEMKIKNVFLLNEEMQMIYYNKCSKVCYKKDICYLYYKVININKVATFEQLNLKTVDRQSFINVVVESLRKSKVFENNMKKAREVDILSANDKIKNRINFTYEEEVKSVIEKISIILY